MGRRGEKVGQGWDKRREWREKEGK